MCHTIQKMLSNFIKMNNPLLQNLKSSNVSLVIAVYFSFLLDNLLLTVVVPIIPDYLFHNGLENDQFEKNSNFLEKRMENLKKSSFPLGTLLASKSFVQLLVTPFLGQVTRIFGYFRPLLFGSFNLTLAALLYAIGETYWVLISARAIHGIASSAINVSGMCLLAERFSSKSRSKIIPLAFGGIATGVLLGYPFGGTAYCYFGKSTPFVFIAILTLSNIWLQVWLFRKQPYELLLIDRNEIEVESSSSLLQLLKSSSIVIILFCICSGTISMAVLESCLPLWLLERFSSISKWQLGTVFIPDSIGYFLASHFGGLLPVEPWRLGLAAMILIGLSCCGIPLANNLHELVIPHFGLGIGVGLTDAALVPLLAKIVDDENKRRGHYGTVYALQQIAVNLAYSFGPFLAGKIVQFVGFPRLIGIIGLTNIFFCVFLVQLENNI